MPLRHWVRSRHFASCSEHPFIKTGLAAFPGVELAVGPASGDTMRLAGPIVLGDVGAIAFIGPIPTEHAQSAAVLASRRTANRRPR
jgi:hypothetical protein